MLERLSLPQRRIVGVAVLAFIVILASWALSRDVLRQANPTPVAVATSAPSPAATVPARPTPVTRPPAVSETPHTALLLGWLALILSAIAAAVAIGAAVAGRRQMATVVRRQGYPVLHCWLAWDATDTHLALTAWNAGPGAATDVRCGLLVRADERDQAMTAYAMGHSIEPGQRLTLAFPTLTRAALATAGTDTSTDIISDITVAWRQSAAGSEEIAHQFRHCLPTPLAPAMAQPPSDPARPNDEREPSSPPDHRADRLAPLTITYARVATRLPGQPRAQHDDALDGQGAGPAAG